MEAALEGRAIVDFPMPEGVRVEEIDPQSGLLAYEGMADPLAEVFVEGSQPTEYAAPPDILSPEDFLMEQLTEEESGAANTARPSDAQEGSEPSATTVAM